MPLLLSVTSTSEGTVRLLFFFFFFAFSFTSPSFRPLFVAYCSRIRPGFYPYIEACILGTNFCFPSRSFILQTDIIQERRASCGSRTHCISITNQWIVLFGSWGFSLNSKFQSCLWRTISDPIELSAETTITTSDPNLASGNDLVPHVT